MNSVFFLPVIAWLFSLGGTQFSLPFLRKMAVMDMPSERSNHRVPVPRGGGVAMIVGALIMLNFAGCDLRLIFAAALLACVSFADDLRGLSVRLRLLAQLAAVASALPILFPLFPLYSTVFVIAACIVITLFWLWFINLTNFMDGIDGITSMQVIMMALGVCAVRIFLPAVPAFLPLYASIIAASALGFYWFNRSPAKCFMGDVGSITLGFLMGYILLSLGLNGAPFAALILPAYYLTDAKLTLVRRLLRGDKVWEAHSEHAYQKAVRSGLSHTLVVRRITCLNAVLILLAIASTVSMIAGVISFLVAYVLTVWLFYTLSNEPIHQ